MHHVAQGAGGFVEGAALFHAQLFGNGDLDVGQVLTPPQGLKQGIAKAQCKQVLDGGFAQVVVNAKNLPLAKDLAHGLVDGVVARQVMPQRLFQHHAGVRRVQAGAGQLLAHGGEEAGRGGDVHDHGVGLTLRQRGGQVGVVAGAGQVHAHEFEQGSKAGEFFDAGAFGQLHLVKARADQGAVLRVAEVVAGDADDAPPRGQRAVAKGLKQRGHQLAPGQVAGAAK